MTINDELVQKFIDDSGLRESYEALSPTRKILKDMEIAMALSEEKTKYWFIENFIDATKTY